MKSDKILGSLKWSFFIVLDHIGVNDYFVAINWVDQITIILVNQAIEFVDMLLLLGFLSSFSLGHLERMLFGFFSFLLYDCLIIPSVILSLRHWSSQLKIMDIISIWNNFLHVRWVVCLSILMDQTIELVDSFNMLLLFWFGKFLCFDFLCELISLVGFFEIFIIIWFWNWTSGSDLKIKIIWDNFLHVWWIISLSIFMNQAIKFIDFIHGSSWDFLIIAFLV